MALKLESIISDANSRLDALHSKTSDPRKQEASILETVLTQVNELVGFIRLPRLLD